MDYLKTTLNVLYYLIYPILVLLGWMSMIFAPVFYLGHYILHAFIVPIRLLAMFESLYIFLGTAAIVGILTGSILHFSSTLLASTLNLDSVPAREGRTAASVRAARREKLPQRLDLPALQIGPLPKLEKPMKREYTDLLEKDRVRRPDGLLSQTILEEDDDSEDEF
ncbi:MAG: hypothetical protein M1827_000586 [Pycnora praestabilis]|nr:MAG: hypothetical protein M1827_000586 [Pycnora praestabilis]